MFSSLPRSVRTMNLTVQSKLPKGNKRTLTAVIDLGAERRLSTAGAVRKHPASSDLQRRKGEGAIDGAYLAIGQQALLYLPAGAAKYWDDDEKVRILAGKAWDAALERGALELVILLDGPD